MTCRIEPLERRTLFDAAGLDASFGSGGKARYDIAGLADRAHAVYALADGKILVAGEATFDVRPAEPPGSLRDADSDPATGRLRSDTRGVLMRLNPDGTIDEGFGTGGTAPYHSDPTATPTSAQRPLQVRIDRISALSVQPDGRILAGGTGAVYRAGVFSEAELDAMRVRDGQGGERALTEDERARANQRTFRDSAFAVARYNPDGSIDTTFGAGGMALANLAEGAGDTGREQVRALALQPDGKIIAFGEVQPADGNGRQRGDTDFATVRLNDDGTLDDSFGLRTEDFSPADAAQPWSERASVVVVQADGKVLVAGGSAGSGGPARGGGFALARYGPDGTKDPTFGDGGRVLTVPPGPPDRPDAARPAAIHALFAEPDGTLLAVGGVGGRHLGLARYNPAGTLDASFGTAGLVVMAGVHDGRYALQRLPDGAVAVAGIGSGRGGVGQDHAGQTPPASRPTTLQAYAARLDAAGRVGSEVRADQLPVMGEEQVFAVTLQPDGKIVGAGAAFPAADAGEGEARSQTADLFIVRIDPLLLPPATPDPGGEEPPTGGGSGPDATMAGKPLVKSGRVYKFRLSFSSLQLAQEAQVVVSGPNGFVADAERVRLKSRKAGGPAVGLYRVAAPAGRFDAGDNGSYQVITRTAAGRTPQPGVTDGTIVGGFQVNSPSRPPVPPGRGRDGTRRKLAGVFVNDPAAGGGETTGWAIQTRRGERFEVDVSAVADVAAGWVGRRVHARGVLKTVAYPGRGEVLVLVVERIRAAR